MTRGIPSLLMLRAFAAAARTGSFTQAASGLHMSQGAVSYQVRTLETQLGIRLFQRAPRKLVLTAEGERLSSSLVKAFGALQAALDDVSPNTANNMLSAAVSTSFATRWLVSRIRGFQQSHPEIQLRILGEDRPDDISPEDQDVVIRYGRSKWPGLEAKLLHRDTVFPVCSPHFLVEHKLDAVSQLKNMPLLNEEGERLFEDGLDWDVWFRRIAPNLLNGGAFHSQRCRIHYAHAGMVLQAAIEGQGVALAGELLVADDLRAGRLVRPLDLGIKSDFAYYFVRSPSKPMSKSARVFLDWLQIEIGKTRRYLENAAERPITAVERRITSESAVVERQIVACGD
jgi:LysR family glycine cleavage system transcriptional activator